MASVWKFIGIVIAAVIAIKLVGWILGALLKTVLTLAKFSISVAILVGIIYLVVTLMEKKKAYR